MKKFLTLALLALALTGCKINVVNNIAVDALIAFEILKQEAYGGRDNESHTVITSQQELGNLYKELGWGSVPAIDFEKYNVVALFMGQKSTGGFTIGIRSMSILDGTTTIKVMETAPQGMATSALTAPYCLAMIPKTDKVVVE